MILVTVPNEGWVHKTVAERMLLLQSDRRHKVRLRFPVERPYENNLHHIVVEFRHGDCDFWLNIDSDNPPMQNPLDLVELDKDIIGLPTPVWHYIGKEGERPIYWNVYDNAQDPHAYR